MRNDPSNPDEAAASSPEQPAEQPASARFVVEEDAEVGDPNKTMVVMTHASSKDKNGTASLAAFKEVWEPQGWTLVTDANPDDPNPVGNVNTAIQDPAGPAN